MIADPEGTTLLSSMGWVDHDALWRFDVARSTTETIPLSTGARHCSLHCVGSGRFAVAHHFDGRRFEVSVRSFSAPGTVLAGAVVEDRARSMAGDSAAWADVPRLYVAYLAFPPWRDFVLLKLSASTRTVEVQRLAWYDGSYDKGYQGIVEVLELPGSGCALVSVQRSSRLILHDLESGMARRSIDLCGRAGNPRLGLRDAGKEVWASDYDTLAVVRTDDWQVHRSSRLQGVAAGTRQFIGDFSFSPDQEICAVARPFSGDVVGIDPRTLRVRHAAKVGRQPLEVVALRGGEVIARDWKTGDLLRGRLERRRFAW